jgi:pilus assembly protein CpaE
VTSQDEMHTGQETIYRRRGKMIAVCSPKGGIGRTTLTVNLAVALNKKNASVAILDGDFQFGDVNLAMDLKDTLTIKEVMESLNSLDEHNLASYLAVHQSGVRVLPAPERPEFADLISSEAVSKILEVMLAVHDFVVVDTPVGLNEQTLQYLENADQILVVTNLEMAALKNTKLFLETLDILGLRSKIRVIINRANMESVINATDAAKILNEESPVFIPNNFQICSQSINLGVPFVIKHSNSDVSKGVYKMAELIFSENKLSQIKYKNNNSLFSKWFSKKRT